MSLFATGNKAGTANPMPCTVCANPAYYTYLLNYIGEADVQRRLRTESLTMEQPVMMASPEEYQFLAWLAATIGAKRIIEVGVFRGVTTLALALALPDDAKIKALDVSHEFAVVGMKAWKEARVDHKIDFILGSAVDSMNKMIEEDKEEGTYDFVFIDANKEDYVTYYEQAMRLVRVGGIIAVDNTLFQGRVIKASEGGPADPMPQCEHLFEAIREVNNRIRNDKRVSAVMTTMADGLTLVRKIA